MTRLYYSLFQLPVPTSRKPQERSPPRGARRFPFLGRARTLRRLRPLQPPRSAVRRIPMGIKPRVSPASQAKESLSYGNKAATDNPVDRR